MKNKDLITLEESLQKVGNLTGFKFVYAVAKNLDILNREIKIIQETFKFSKDFQKYDLERVELAKKFSKKDKDGKDVVVNNAFVLEDEKGFRKELEILKKSNKKVIEIREKQVEDLNKLLEEESNIKLHKIQKEDIPENITGSQLFNILSIINEEKKNGK